MPRGFRFAKAAGREGESSVAEASAGVESKNAEDAAAVCRKLRRDGTVGEEIFAGMVKKRFDHGAWVVKRRRVGGACGFFAGPEYGAELVRHQETQKNKTWQRWRSGKLGRNMLRPYKDGFAADTPCHAPLEKLFVADG